MVDALPRTCVLSPPVDHLDGGMTALVLDGVQTLLPELGQVVEHAFQHLGGMALSALQLGDDAQRVAVR
jgi:hypothetical protein